MTIERDVPNHLLVHYDTKIDAILLPHINNTPKEATDRVIQALEQFHTDLSLFTQEFLSTSTLKRNLFDPQILLLTGQMLSDYAEFVELPSPDHPDPYHRFIALSENISPADMTDILNHLTNQNASSSIREIGNTLTYHASLNQQTIYKQLLRYRDTEYTRFIQFLTGTQLAQGIPESDTIRLAGLLLQAESVIIGSDYNPNPRNRHYIELSTPMTEQNDHASISPVNQPDSDMPIPSVTEPPIAEPLVMDNQEITSGPSKIEDETGRIVVFRYYELNSAPGAQLLHPAESAQESPVESDNPVTSTHKDNPDELIHRKPDDSNLDLLPQSIKVEPEPLDVSDILIQSLSVHKPYDSPVHQAIYCMDIATFIDAMKLQLLSVRAHPAILRYTDSVLETNIILAAILRECAVHDAVNTSQWEAFNRKTEEATLPILASLVKTNKFTNDTQTQTSLPTLSDFYYEAILPMIRTLFANPLLVNYGFTNSDIFNLAAIIATGAQTAPSDIFSSPSLPPKSLLELSGTNPKDVARTIYPGSFSDIQRHLDFLEQLPARIEDMYSLSPLDSESDQ